jgi:hypothetical protein
VIGDPRPRWRARPSRNTFRRPEPVRVVSAHTCHRGSLVTSLRLGVVVLTLAVAACGPQRASRSAVDAGDVIARQEIVAAHVQNVYELVERLHPHWLRKRGVNQMRNDGDIVVYLDNARLGGPESLRGIHVGGVSSVRFFDAGRAQYRFGVGHTHGAILVSTGTP